MKPNITVENVHYLREGDHLLLKANARTPTTLKVYEDYPLEVSYISPEGLIEFKEKPGCRYNPSLFQYRLPSLIGLYPERTMPKAGDTVVLLDTGWGLGEDEGAKLLKPYTVEAIEESKGNKYKYRVKLEGFKSAVNPKAVRLVTELKPIEAQQNIADEMLCVLNDNKFISDCFVAGGAPRNWDHGKPARDLDVYVLPTKSSVAANRIFQWLYDLTYKAGVAYKRPRILGKEHHDYDSEHIQMVINLTYKGMDVDVIIVNPKSLGLETFYATVMEKFNCNLCKVTYTTVDGIRRTAAYKTDVLNKTLTYPFYKYEADYHRKRSLEVHIPKMMQYFPEHTVVIQQSPEGVY